MDKHCPSDTDRAGLMTVRADRAGQETPPYLGEMGSTLMMNFNTLIL